MVNLDSLKHTCLRIVVYKNCQRDSTTLIVRLWTQIAAPCSDWEVLAHLHRFNKSCLECVLRLTLFRLLVFIIFNTEESGLNNTVVLVQFNTLFLTKNLFLLCRGYPLHLWPNNYCFDISCSFFPILYESTETKSNCMIFFYSQNII